MLVFSSLVRGICHSPSYNNISTYGEELMEAKARITMTWNYIGKFGGYALNP